MSARDASRDDDEGFDPSERDADECMPLHAPTHDRQSYVNLGAPMIVTTNTGERFAGTANQVVSQMRRAQWTTPERKGAYMVEVADRIRMISTDVIDTSDAPSFLGSLATHGYVSVVDSTIEQRELSERLALLTESLDHVSGSALRMAENEIADVCNRLSALDE